MSGAVRRVGDDRGTVTAELALTMPAVLAVLAFGLGAVAVATQAVVVQDAASVVARSASRGDGTRLPPSAPAGSSVRVWADGDLTCAHVSATARVAGMALPISAESCALGSGS